MTDDTLRPRRALVSVYDKTGLPELARALHDAVVDHGATVVAPAGVDHPFRCDVVHPPRHQAVEHRRGAGTGDPVLEQRRDVD